MSKEPVDGDNLGEVWDAVVGNEGFEVCYDEFFNTCYYVDSIQNLGLIGLGIILLEVAFWVYVVRVIYKRRKQKKSIWNEEP